MGKCTFGNLQLFLHGEVATWEIATWVNVHLGSCRFSFLGNLPLGTLSFGKMYIRDVAAWEIAHLGSATWKIVTWEVAHEKKHFGKVPNIVDLLR